MQYSFETCLKKIQECELEILDEFHRICKKCHLRYSLFYGTLIGAVRHQGFIPWDDDIDIMMPREDYEKLLSVWNDEADSAYILQTYYTDLDYTNNFAKIRKNHTTFIQYKEEINRRYHKGIFIDVFPADRVAQNWFLKKLQLLFFSLNLLYSRGYGSGEGGVVGAIEKLLLLLPKRTYFAARRITEKAMTLWNANNHLLYVCAGSIKGCSEYYPSNMFDRLQIVGFNRRKYYCVIDTDSILRVVYGDYMLYPPEEERVWRHHPLLIDFNRNYEDIPSFKTNDL